MVKAQFYIRKQLSAFDVSDSLGGIAKYKSNCSLILNQWNRCVQQCPNVLCITFFNSLRNRLHHPMYMKRLIELLRVTKRLETWVRATATYSKASRMLATIAKMLHDTNTSTTTICILARFCCSCSKVRSLNIDIGKLTKVVNMIWQILICQTCNIYVVV